jgi:hypothetical protein
MLGGNRYGPPVMTCHPGGIVVAHVPVAYLRPTGDRVPGLRMVPPPPSLSAVAAGVRALPPPPPVVVEGRSKALDRRAAALSAATVTNSMAPDLVPGGRGGARRGFAHRMSRPSRSRGRRARDP